MKPDAARLSSKRPAPSDETVLVEALLNATRAFKHRLRPVLEAERLSAPMFWTLHQLVADGPLHVGEIAEACVVTPANVSSSVDALVGEGLALRQASAKDRRFVLVSATPRGRTTHRAVWTQLGRALFESLEGVSGSELAVTARVLGRLGGGTALSPPLEAA